MGSAFDDSKREGGSAAVARVGGKPPSPSALRETTARPGTAEDVGEVTAPFGELPELFRELPLAVEPLATTPPFLPVDPIDSSFGFVLPSPFDELRAENA